MNILELAVKQMPFVPAQVTPKLVQFNVSQIREITPRTTDTQIKLTNGHAFIVAETPSEIQAQVDPSSANLFAQNVKTGITASATQTQAGGTALTKYLNVVSTSATAGDAVTLPTAVVGAVCIVVNAAVANTITIFPFLADAIDANAVNAGVTLVAGAKQHFYAIDATTWKTVTPSNV